MHDIPVVSASLFIPCLFVFSREVAETSPYYEALKKDDVEVGLFMSYKPYEHSVVTLVLSCCTM